MGSRQRTEGENADGERTVVRLAFSPDAKKLAAVIRNGGFSNPVWDVASGKELFTFEGREVAFRTQGKELVSIDGGLRMTVRHYDAVRGKGGEEWTISHFLNASFGLSADGRFASIPVEGIDLEERRLPNGPPLRNVTNSAVLVFDLNQRTEAKKLLFPHGHPFGSGFTDDGRLLVVAGLKGLRVWEWSSAKVLCN